MKTTLITALGIFSALSLTAGPAYSAGVTNAQEVNCLDLMRIDHTDVVDNQNILFYMHSEKISLESPQATCLSVDGRRISGATMDSLRCPESRSAAFRTAMSIRLPVVAITFS